MSRRVVITGMGMVSPLGLDVQSTWSGILEKRSGVRHMPAWREVDGLLTEVGAPMHPDFDPMQIKRAFRRSMGPQALYAATAAQQAVEASGLTQEQLQDGRTGLAVGSTLGSPKSTHDFFETYFAKKSVVGLKGTAFLQCMGHTCAANLAVMFGIRGRVVAPLSACASGTQAIGTAYEMIKHGTQDVVLTGGADEAHFTTAVTFDLVRGTSLGYHDNPDCTPRPFDEQRDGLVVGAGSAVVVLEELEHAEARGAEVLAEVVGYGTNCDGSHMSQPDADGMVRCISAALASAEVAAADIDYVNAHATATRVGDATEADAIRRAFGDRPLISSQKGHIGHTLGACGAIETVFTVLALRQGIVPPTKNLQTVDPACAGLNHVTEPQETKVKTAVTQNFAFGGVNAALVLRKV